MGKKVIPELEEGELTKHGYRMNKSASARRRALAKSVKEDGYMTTVHRLIALQVFFKRNKKLKNIAISDRKWLVKKYGKG